MKHKFTLPCEVLTTFSTKYTSPKTWQNEVR